MLQNQRKHVKLISKIFKQQKVEFMLGNKKKIMKKKKKEKILPNDTHATTKKNELIN